jgi:hypothetical protein
LRTTNGLHVCAEPESFLWPRVVSKTCLPASLMLAMFLSSISPAQVSGPNNVSENSLDTIHGVVENAITHQPLARALVYSSDNRFATLTNSEGEFEFSLPKSDDSSASRSANTAFIGGIMLMARKPGFLDDPNERNQRWGSPGSELTLALVPEALIVGKVTLPAGDSARGVSVQLFSRQVRDGVFHWQMANSVIANSMGEFRIAELRPGTYKLSTTEWMDNGSDPTGPGAQHYGYPPVYYPNASDYGGAGTINLTAGETVQADFSLVRQPYFPVKIPVTSSEGDMGLNVTVSPQARRGPGYSLGYNQAHSMIEGELPNGKYLVEGFSYRANPSTPGMNFSTSGSVNLTVAGAPAEGPAMALAPDNAITVNVKEEFTSTNFSSRPQGFVFSGRPLNGPRGDLFVSAQRVDDFGMQRGGNLRPPQDSNDDSMILENLGPGKYWLQLHANRGYVASATMAGSDLLHDPLVVVPGANAQIDVVLRDDTAELEGSLPGIAPPAEPTTWQPRAYIYCIPLPDSTGQFTQMTAGADGKFDDRAITPGAYRVIAFDSQHNDIPYRDVEAMKAYESKGQVVHLGPGEKVSLQLQLISGAD